MSKVELVVFLALLNPEIKSPLNLALNKGVTLIDIHCKIIINRRTKVSTLINDRKSDISADRIEICGKIFFIQIRV